MPNTTAATDALTNDGYAWVQLDANELRRLEALRAGATAFFARSEAEKLRHGSADFNFGFRPFGRQYSVTPDRPDMNESFTYWADTPQAIPEHQRIAQFIEVLRAHRLTVAQLARNILADLSDRFSHTEQLAFENSSYIEVNSYFRTDERDLLQDRHEDGHLLTILTSDGPGLEIETNRGMVPVSFEPGHLLVMPGSLLTDMTGGLISPLFHQVRNHRCRSRMSVLYLVNPLLDQYIQPFVTTDHNRGVDIAAKARTNVQMFGLPESPVLP